MTYMDVLEKWAIYSEYDREQTSFNLLSRTYGFHKVGKLIEMLLSEYDNTGMLAVIYAKIQFENLLKETKITVWDVLSNPDTYKAEKDMYELFNIPIVAEAENEFIGRLNHIYLKITNGKLIGEDGGQRKQLLNSIEKVVESINKCNVDLFMKGGEISNVQNVSAKLHVFNTLAECLLSIEKAKDGIYFCFISAGNSADCFFAFFLKSNGTIISVNDRIDEAYIGQHRNSRNGRWAESKVDGIFPYDYIFNYSQHDYKGYATKYEIEEDKLDLYNLGIEVFMPIVISILLIVLKYSNKDIELPLHYLDSFLPENQLKIESHELMIIGENSLVIGHNNIDIHFDNQKILSGDYAEEFDFHNNGNYKETGYFTNDNQLMVDLWGDGFVFDSTAIFKSNNIACLMDKENESYIPEFVGTEKRMRLQVYKEARKQLADYMEDKIYQAWVDYGKTEAIKKWYQQSLLSNKEVIYRMLMEYEEEVENGKKLELGSGWRRSDGSINIYITRNDDYPSGHMLSSDEIIGCTRGCTRNGWKWFCNVTGCVCNMWFVIAPQTWEQLEFLTGQEVPKIVKGWNVNGRPYYGNPLLDSTDAAARVGTPFEHSNSYWSNDRFKDAYYNFTVAFGFSKRGWNKIEKELKER